MVNEESTETIKLVSNDEKEFVLPTETARLSKIVDNAFDDDDETVTPPETFDILRVRGECLEKVVEFLKHYVEEPLREIPMPLGGSSMDEVVNQEWYKTFVTEMTRDMLFEVLTAANYMEIKPLLDLACLKVTFELQNKNADEIREILNLPELTPEEEARAREEHRWIFEDNTN